MKLLLSLTVLLAVVGGMSMAQSEPITTVTLRSGHSVVLPAPGLTRLAVGDGRIAGVVPIGRSEVVVNGKAAGQTTLFVWRADRRYTYEVNVTEQTADDMAALIRYTIADPSVRVISTDRSVVLLGSVRSPEQLAHFDSILARFEPEAKANKYTLVDAVTVTRPLGAVQDSLIGIPGASGVLVTRDAQGNLIVSGRVPDRVAAERALDQIKASAGGALQGDAKVIDHIGVDTISQVDIKVYILEVDKTAMQQLGIRLQSATPIFNEPGFYTLGTPSFPAIESPFVNGSGAPNSGPSTAGRFLNIGAFLRTTVLAPTLDLLMQNGHAKLLSSPDLVTLPGRKATFLVGGQIPIPYASGPQQIAIEYKNFGVQLNITPTLLGNGAVATQISPEVSDLDFADGIVESGFSIPALKTSTLSTNVVTNDGESIIMGGLLRHEETRTINKIPLLGDLPILGKLFRSTAYQNLETDVVFVMTPYVLTR